MSDQAKTVPRICLLFVAEDADVAYTLEKHLSTLRSSGKIHIWTPTQILAGANQEQAYEEALGDADGVLLLLSGSFLASDFFVTVLLPKLFRRASTGSLHIVPVLLKHCTWEFHESLAKLVPIPRDRQPIVRDGSLRDQLLVEVVVELKNVLDSLDWTSVRKVRTKNEGFFEMTDLVNDNVIELPEAKVTAQHKHWDRFQVHVDSLQGDKKLDIQRLNTLHYLQQYGLSVTQLKEQLRNFGDYHGDIDDVFTDELATAISNFQRRRNLRHIDGVFGPLTYLEMEKAAKKPRRKPNG